MECFLSASSFRLIVDLCGEHVFFLRFGPLLEVCAVAWPVPVKLVQLILTRSPRRNHFLVLSKRENNPGVCSFRGAPFLFRGASV